MRQFRRTNEQQQRADAQVEYRTDVGVSFTNGVMLVDGQPQQPLRVKRWMSSNELTVYTTVEWNDPANPGVRRTSCNCPGWTNKKGGKRRRCMHTDDMEGGTPCVRKAMDEHTIVSSDQAINLITGTSKSRALLRITLD